MSSPSSATLPALGRTSPEIVRSSEVLPAPLAPSTAVTVPSGTFERDAVDRAHRPVVGGQLLNRQHRLAAAASGSCPPRLAAQVGLEHAADPRGPRPVRRARSRGRSRAPRRGRRPTSRGPCGARRASPRSSCASAPISSASSDQLGLRRARRRARRAAAARARRRARGPARPASAPRTAASPAGGPRVLRSPAGSATCVARSRSARSSRSDRGSAEQRAANARATEPLGADHHVLEHGQPGEQPDALQRPRDPERRQAVGTDRGRAGAAPGERARVRPYEAADRR